MAIGITLASFAIGNGTTSIPLPAYNQAAGRTIVLLIHAASSVTAVSDTAGNTYGAATVSLPAAFGSHNSYAWVIKNCLGNANNVITITQTTTTVFTEIYYYDLSGANLVTPLDGSNTNTSASNTPTPSVTLTTTNAADGILMLVGCDSGFSVPSSPTIGGHAMNLDKIQGSGGNISSTSSLVASNTFTGSTAQLTFGTSAPFSAVILGIAPLPTFSISGNAGTAGATVSWSGAASGSMTADGSGNYTIPNLANGSYTITPSKTGFTFSPTSSNQTVSGSNITGVNFTATSMGNAYSVPDSRVITATTPNSSRTVNGTKIYDVPKVDSRAAGAPVDSRVAPNIPVASGTYPQNSRTPGTFGPGE